MAEFLELLPPSTARSLLLNHLAPKNLPSEEIPVQTALRRVTAGPIVASEPLPAFDRSTVDGFAVRAQDTFGANDSLPAYLQLVGEIPMGRAPAVSIGPGTAALIHTGGMLPAGADAVVMVEQTQAARADELEVLKAVAVGENTLKAGEDVQPGSEILPAGMRLRPAEIGGLMALGLMTVRVVKKPRIAVLSSGDEIIPPQESPRPGQVRDINSYALAALIEDEGGTAVLQGIIPDRKETLAQAVSRSVAECDAVVITAGSSASTRDLTAEIIDQLGPPGILVHGINVKPGKPTILGVCQGKAVIGLPGNPVSALVVARIFVTAVVRRLLGLAEDHPQPVIPARLTINLASQAGREDWIPVRLVPSEQGMLAEPIFYKSNLIFSLARADGLIHIPADVTGLDVNEWVNVEIL